MDHMKLTRNDIIMLIVVMVFSGIFYVFIGDALSNTSRVLIILIFGYVVGLIQRRFFNKGDSSK